MGGRWPRPGVGLVFGGGGDGLMGRVARASLDEGGRVTGIIPKFLLKREHALRRRRSSSSSTTCTSASN